MYKSQGKSLELCVEAQPNPIDMTDLHRIMKEKSGESPTHHNNNTQNPF